MTRLMATWLVTGSNRGIGLELCRQLKARGDTVIATCRSKSKALEAVGVELLEGVDTGDDASVERLAKRLGDRTLDVVVNNAGILEPDNLDSLSFDSIRRQLEVNSLGPLRVTRALRPCFTRGTKVAIVTSRMGSIADNTSGGMYGYRMSKTAVNMAAASLARDLAPSGVAVILLHPGFVKTEMTGGNGHIDASEAARNLIARIDAATIDDSGTFRHANGESLPW
jgi:NAD(P)-dependent dehydrogenase (short-subunit alcohol dehydrogenase family)